ncbi:hypothetical protein [Streptomyces sp. NPDC017993]|uniref:hypothetical protein n=1 Tax=Streptomyces sp. NPDC017993 TaxID=3365027 RepID=UPI003793F812
MQPLIRQAAIDNHTRSIGRALTAGFRSLYPHHTDGHATVRPLTCRRTARLYERAQPASAALAARVKAAMTGAVSPLQERRLRRQQATDLAAARSSQKLIAAAAAKLHDGVKERAVAHGPHLQPDSAPKRPYVPQQPNPGPAHAHRPQTTDHRENLMDTKETYMNKKELLRNQRYRPKAAGVAASLRGTPAGPAPGTPVRGCGDLAVPRRPAVHLATDGCASCRA